MMRWKDYKKGDIDIPEGVPILVQRKEFDPHLLYRAATFSKDLYKVNERAFRYLRNRKNRSGFYWYDCYHYEEVKGVTSYRIMEVERRRQIGNERFKFQE